MEQSDFGDNISADFEHREQLELAHKNLRSVKMDCMYYLRGIQLKSSPNYT